MVERARRNLSHVANVEVAVGSIADMALPDACGDRLLAYSVLQYLDGEATLVRALREIFRVLRPGGSRPAGGQSRPGAARRPGTGDPRAPRPGGGGAGTGAAGHPALGHPERLCELARDAGIPCPCRSDQRPHLQHFYMFDLVLEKP